MRNVLFFDEFCFYLNDVNRALAPEPGPSSSRASSPVEPTPSTSRASSPGADLLEFSDDEDGTFTATQVIFFFLVFLARYVIL